MDLEKRSDSGKKMEIPFLLGYYLTSELRRTEGKREIRDRLKRIFEGSMSRKELGGRSTTDLLWQMRHKKPAKKVHSICSLIKSAEQTGFHNVSV